MIISNGLIEIIVGRLNQIYKMKLVFVNTNLGLYTRIKMKPQLNICWTEKCIGLVGF
jgi:predicted transcriptional regulator